MWDELSDPLEELPTDPAERALALEQALIARARGGALPDRVYRVLRKELMDDPSTLALLPKFVRTSRDPQAFWSYIRNHAPTYARREAHIREKFVPLLDFLERGQTPAAEMISGVLQRYDNVEVHRVWKKALKRSSDDPEGAITAARTLLESVCKHILDELGVTYGPSDDLPKLYGAVSRGLNLSPSQHSGEFFKRILGGCSSVVEGLGSLRNKMGDAHGQGRSKEPLREPVRPAPRHAHLAVNLAGSMAVFLIETSESRSAPEAG